MKFAKGTPKPINSGKKRGTKDKKTIIKEAIGIKTMEDLKDICLQNWFDFLKDENKQIRLIATKETSKYLFPKKREINLGLQESELELLRQAAAEQMRKAL